MYAINVRKPSTQIQHLLYIRELIKERDSVDSAIGGNLSLICQALLIHTRNV